MGFIDVNLCSERSDGVLHQCHLRLVLTWGLRDVGLEAAWLDANQEKCVGGTGGVMQSGEGLH